MSVRRVLQGIIGIVVGAVCLWLAFRGMFNGAGSTEQDTGVSFGDVTARIRAVPLWAHLAFAAQLVLQFALRSERWRVQVRGLTGQKPPLRTSLAINAAGVAAVFLLPFRLGEFVRPNLSARHGIMRASAGMAATVLERAVDGMVTTGFFGVLMLVLRDRDIPAWVRVGGFSALGVFGGAMVFLVAAYVSRGHVVRAVARISSLAGETISKRVTATLEGFLDGLACFKAPRDVLVYVLLTVAFWLANAASMWTLMIGMSLDVPFSAAVFCLCFLVIGMMMPAPPGNVGNFHAFARVALTVFGVSTAPAVAYAVLLHGWSTVGVTVWALAFFLSGDLTLSGVREAAHEGPATDVRT